MRNHFTLSFINGELNQTEFIAEPWPVAIRSIRGKTAGAYGDVGSFQWTSAVQALAVLCIKTAAYDESVPSEACLLSGGAGTFASSLDYALSKNPLWLMEMFGVHLRGEGFIRRLVKISNSNRKRPGPVVLSINQKLLAPSDIKIIIDGTPCFQSDQLKMFAEQLSFNCVEQAIARAA